MTAGDFLFTTGARKGPVWGTPPGNRMLKSSILKFPYSTSTLIGGILGVYGNPCPLTPLNHLNFARDQFWPKTMDWQTATQSTILAICMQHASTLKNWKQAKFYIYL